jgi:hypothetical protein
MLALLQREGKELASRPEKGGWQALVREYTFSLVGQTGVTGNTTLGSNIVTGIADTSGITVGQAITGGGILASSYITAVGANSVTLNQTCVSSDTVTNITIGTDQYPFPTDFVYIIPGTEWDRSFRWQLLGPMDAVEWQTLKSGITPTGPRMRFRIKEDRLFIDPVPGANLDNMVIEYISSSWCRSALGAAQSKWLTDTDTPVILDDLYVMGLKWRFLRAKGLDYAQEQYDYENAVLRCIGRDGTVRNLPMNAQQNANRLLSQCNVPDTGFGR